MDNLREKIAKVLGCHPQNTIVTEIIAILSHPDDKAEGFWWQGEFQYLLDRKILSRDELAYLFGQIKSIIDREKLSPPPNKEVEEANLLERIATITAHRACCGSEHNPAKGKFHGHCIVCGVPYPCEYASKLPQSHLGSVGMTEEEIEKILSDELNKGLMDEQDTLTILKRQSKALSSKLGLTNRKE